MSITASLAQQGNTSTLTIKKIMQGDDFVGHLPSDPQWSTDGQTLYFNWNPEQAQVTPFMPSI